MAEERGICWMQPLPLGSCFDALETPTHPMPCWAPSLCDVVIIYIHTEFSSSLAVHTHTIA